MNILSYKEFESAYPCNQLFLVYSHTQVQGQYVYKEFYQSRF